MEKTGELLSRFQSSTDDRERNLIFGHVYDRYNNLVLHTIGQFSTLSEQHVKDLAQDAWLIITKNLDSFKWEAEKGFTKWVYIITRNLALKAAESTQQEQRNRADIDEQHLQPDTETQTEQKSADYAIKHLLEILKDNDPKGFEFMSQKLLQNKTYREIAAQYGKSEDAIRKKVDRALERLRTRLKQEYGVTSMEEWFDMHDYSETI